MNLSPDNYAAFTFALITFSVTVHHGYCQGSTCSLFARPHPRGYCGARLAEIHSNLCLFMRLVHPLHFPTVKRSVSEYNDDALLDLPLSTFIDLFPEMTMDEQSIERDLSSTSFDDQQTQLFPSGYSSVTPQLTSSMAKHPKGILQVLKKRSIRNKRNIVCDCCYNQCSPRILAHYC